MMEIEMADYNAPSSSRASTLNRRSLSHNVQRLQDTLAVLFNTDDRVAFIDSLNDYHRCRDVYDFVHSLKYLLDTTAKQHMIPLLRKVIPQSDVPLFDKYVSDEDLYPMELRKIKAESELTSDLSRKGRATEFPSPHRTLGSPESSSVVVKRIRLRKGPDGLGFSIRGGAEHGIGIYVSYVDQNSQAEHEGLAPGDQVITVNDVAFQNITHDEAAKILKFSKKLDLVVKSVGRIPGSYVVHQTYTWVDPSGYPVPPPPEIDRTGRYEAHGQRKSGLMLLKDRDERKVNVVVEDGESLGLMIRGGNEFGLGIYITGVDAYSVAENAGLKVGDQILDVNGQSFLDICHSDAVRVLKGSPHMMMTIKDVGKLPYARTTYDQTHWIVGIPAQPNDVMSSGRTHEDQPNGRLTVVETAPRRESVFSRGAGSQLMYGARETAPSQQWAMIMDQAKKLLNDEERMTLTYYLSEYHDDHVTLEALLLALFELLNTQAKFSLLSDIRTLIAPRDLDQFDNMVMKREVEAMKDKIRGRQPEVGLKNVIDNIDGNRRNGFTQESGGRRALTGPVKVAPQPRGRTPSPRRQLVEKQAVADMRPTPRDRLNGGAMNSPDSGVEVTTNERRRRTNQHSRSPPAVRSNAAVVHSQAPLAVAVNSPTSTAPVHQVKPNAHSRQAPGQESDVVHVYKSKPTLGVAIEGGANTRQPMPRIINIQKIRVKKSKPVIGIAIVGGAETIEPLPRVIELKPGGSAYDSGLKVGHVILEVDGQPLKGLEHKDVAQVIARAFKKRDKDFMELLVADANSKLAVVK